MRTSQKEKRISGSSDRYGDRRQPPAGVRNDVGGATGGPIMIPRTSNSRAQQPTITSGGTIRLTTSLPTATGSVASSGNANGMMGPSSIATAATTTMLQKELTEVTVKHKEEMYWLQLELDTARREKEAVEDRMAELYRDMQEMQDMSNRLSRGGNGSAASSSSRLAFPNSQRDALSHDVSELQLQVEKQDRMLRIMNNQIALVRSSSDSVVRSLKAEISDLVDEKCRVEIELMNKLADLERENFQLKQQLEQQQQQLLQQSPMMDGNDGSASTESTSAFSKLSRGGGGTRRASMGHVSTVHSTSSSNSMQSELEEANKQLRSDVQRLKSNYRKVQSDLVQERQHRQEQQQAWQHERSKMVAVINKLQDDITVLRSSADMVQRLDQLNSDREETLDTLERVATLWDRADESIQTLESVMIELKPREDHVDQDRERLLSTLETASLVHGQVKVSLMLIELKLRNNLACLTNDHFQLGAFAPHDETILDRLVDIQNEAMAAIGHVEHVLDQQLEQLGEQSVTETRVVRETLQAKVEDLERMKARQTSLEEEISTLKEEALNRSRDNEEQQHDSMEKKGGDSTAASNESNVELFVSRKVLERLQEEVLQVIDRVKEKNETIGRLTAIVEEHKVREGALERELQRHTREQAERQVQEQQRLMMEQAMQASQLEDTDDGEEGSFGSSSEYEEEIVEEEVVEDDSSDYEEKSIGDNNVDVKNTSSNKSL